MSVREHFRTNVYHASNSNKERKRLMEKAGYIQLPYPQQYKVSELAQWCDVEIGHEMFVICQDRIFFQNIDCALKYKLMFEMKEVLGV